MKKIIFITGITIFCVILIYFIYTAAYCKDETLILQNFKEELDTYAVRATPGLMFLLIIFFLLVAIITGFFISLVCYIASVLSEKLK